MPFIFPPSTDPLVGRRSTILLNGVYCVYPPLFLHTSVTHHTQESLLLSAYHPFQNGNKCERERMRNGQIGDWLLKWKTGCGDAGDGGGGGWLNWSLGWMSQKLVIFSFFGHPHLYRHNPHTCITLDSLHSCDEFRRPMNPHLRQKEIKRWSKPPLCWKKRWWRRWSSFLFFFSCTIHLFWDFCCCSCCPPQNHHHSPAQELIQEENFIIRLPPKKCSRRQ